MKSHSQICLSADDRLDIQGVIARSAFNSDFQHWEAFASIYTEDAVTQTDSHDFLIEGIAGPDEHARSR